MNYMLSGKYLGVGVVGLKEADIRSRLTLRLPEEQCILYIDIHIYLHDVK